MTEDKEGLKLLEKQPGYGKVVVLVGPDGGGKTFLAKKLVLENPNAILIDGTHPQNWPISDDKKRSLARFKERYQDDSLKYFGSISLALHKTILEIAKQGKDVIVDSEQTFKFLMWEDMRGNLDKAVNVLKNHKFKAILPDSIRYVVPDAESFDQQAELIWEQQNKKPISQRSDIDPKNLEEVKTRLEASEHVIFALEKLGVNIEGKPDWIK